jgi:hypothetical protein
MAVIEVVTFRLAADVEKEEFVVADKRAQTEFHYLQPGLLRRTTAQDSDGEWLVLTLWASARDADAAAAAAGGDPTVTLLMSLTDPASVTARRYQSLE